jgi:uncharacterized membrane-anchored protein
MALFLSKVDEVTKILSEHLQEKIKTDLRHKLHEFVDAEIRQICEEATRDLVDRIEAYNGTTSEISVNIMFKEPRK